MGVRFYQTIKIISWTLISFLLTNNVTATKALINWNHSSQKNIDSYLKQHKAFSKNLCSAGTDQKYYKLYKNFLGKGFYIPMINGMVDKKSIQTHLKLIHKKKIWIRKIIKKYSYNRKSIYVILDKIQHNLKQISKNQHLIKNEVPGNKKALLATQKNRKEIKKLHSNYQELINNIPFLLNYQFPVDYFSLRKKYDQTKNVKKQVSNQIYLKRRILEDGAIISGKRTDVRLRALLSTLFIRIERINHQNLNYLPENIRYDLNFLISKIENLTKNNFRGLLRALKKWKSKIDDFYSFYKNMIGSKDDLYFKELVTARKILKQFSAKKQSEVYQYWIKQKELFQALYVLETILFNEVGHLDGPGALERKDVAQLVLNRYHVSKYYLLSNKGPLSTYLKRNKVKARSRWLNLLFKEGEFSFTYYYITSSVNIYCPSMSRRSKRLRKENLKIALDLLKRPNWDFKALRFFSRESMIGRIDMTPLWPKYRPLNERAGNTIKDISKLKNKFRSGTYQYLYSFYDDAIRRKFDVIKIDKKTRPNVVLYSKDKGHLKFRNYRNPHHFKYFVLKMN